MKKMLRLKDGTQVLIRPMTLDDLDRAFAFFKGLPEEDRIFLRFDVTQRDLLEERIRMVETGKVKRLVAVVGVPQYGRLVAPSEEQVITRAEGCSPVSLFASHRRRGRTAV